MPELPEVETVRRGLAPVMEGAVFIAAEARRADLRIPLPAAFETRLKGARVGRLERRGKYLLAPLSSGETLIMHLGMSGRFTVHADGAARSGDLYYAAPPDPAHDHVTFTLENGRRLATPLFMALVLVEITDVIFAVDSIPAIFAITTDPFIVLTSNVFAILGLRAMYFLLAAVAAKFHLLSYGLAVILVFIGTKMVLIDVYKIPVLVSLGVVVGILAATMLLSVRSASVAPMGRR